MKNYAFLQPIEFCRTRTFPYTNITFSEAFQNADYGYKYEIYSRKIDELNRSSRSIKISLLNNS